MYLSVTALSLVLIKLTLILIASLLLTAYLYTKWTHSYWRKRGVRHEKPYPIVGNLEFLMRRSWYDYFRALAKKFPVEYVGIYLGHKPTLVLQSPELVKNVLVKDAAHFEDRYSYGGNLDPLGRYNLFNVKKPLWSMIRKECNPMFTSSRLRLLTNLMNDNSKELVSKIDRDHVQQQQKLSLKQLFLMYTSDTIGFTVFGLRSSVLSGQACPLWLITSYMIEFTFWRGLEFNLILLVPLVAKLIRSKFFSAPATEYVTKLFWNVVESRKKTGNVNEIDLVNILLKMKENFQITSEKDPVVCDNIMLAQAAVFILGSVETGSTTLTFCLYELAYHPEEQEKLFRELDKAVKRTGKEILEYDDLFQLKYLTSCILETLRLHPPVPHIDRICNKEYQLTDSLTIEAGTPVLVNIQAIHNNPDYYPDPEEWKPERFSGDNENDNRQYTFLPFGEGPRGCIGKRFGMMQMRAALAQVIHKYRVEPPEDGNCDMSNDPFSPVLSARCGGQVKFIIRN